MTNIIFKNLKTNNETTLDAQNGQSIMEIAVENSIPGIIAECGGACSCATCHVYVDKQWLDHLPPMDIMEEDMLDFAQNLKENSRLSCQIHVNSNLDGMIVYIPEQ